jgi:hypothetical protein
MPVVDARATERSDLRPEERAAAWTERAVAASLDIWSRAGRRYARRLMALDQLGDALEVMLTLAARRVVPLTGTAARVVEGRDREGWALRRPLPNATMAPIARAFNSLAGADRYALIRLDLLGPGLGARGEHLASALGRLVDATKDDRPPP